MSSFRRLRSSSNAVTKFLSLDLQYFRTHVNRRTRSRADSHTLGPAFVYVTRSGAQAPLNGFARPPPVCLLFSILERARDVSEWREGLPTPRPKAAPPPSPPPRSRRCDGQGPVEADGADHADHAVLGSERHDRTEGPFGITARDSAYLTGVVQSHSQWHCGWCSHWRRRWPLPRCARHRKYSSGHGHCAAWPDSCCAALCALVYARGSSSRRMAAHGPHSPVVLWALAFTPCKEVTTSPYSTIEASLLTRPSSVRPMTLIARELPTSSLASTPKVLGAALIGAGVYLAAPGALRVLFMYGGAA